MPSEARRLYAIFAVVYFAQGMWYLPVFPVTFFLKERLGLSAAETATFFSITLVPWLLKPAYGLMSDAMPLLGRRRQSYFVLAAALATAMGVALSAMSAPTYSGLAVLLTLMGLGLAFTDVLVDAMMVESGQRLGLIGAFQAVQWGAISVASIAVGIGGGWLAERADLRLTFLITTAFPAISLVVGIFAISEPPVPRARGELARTWRAVRAALSSPPLWLVAGFIFFYDFSPSLGPALLYYATDVLQFSKMLIGALDAIYYGAGAVGAALYFVWAGSVGLRTLLHISIAAGVASTLAYFGYVGPASAVALSAIAGAIAMIVQLVLLELAARACPPAAAATVFALLMSVYNGALQLSQITGGKLYDQVGYRPLIVVSAAVTALSWLLLPFLRVDGAARSRPRRTR